MILYLFNRLTDCGLYVKRILSALAPRFTNGLINSSTNNC